MIKIKAIDNNTPQKKTRKGLYASLKLLRLLHKNSLLEEDDYLYYSQHIVSIYLQQRLEKPFDRFQKSIKNQLVMPEIQYE